MTKKGPDNSLVNHTADFFFFYINVLGSASSSPDAINYPSLKAPECRQVLTNATGTQSDSVVTLKHKRMTDPLRGFKPLPLSPYSFGCQMSEMSPSGLKSKRQPILAPSGSSKGKFISLPSPDSRSYSYSLACGLLLRLQNQQWRLSLSYIASS